MFDSSPRAALEFAVRRSPVSDGGPRAIVFQSPVCLPQPSWLSLCLFFLIIVVVVVGSFSLYRRRRIVSCRFAFPSALRRRNRISCALLSPPNDNATFVVFARFRSTGRRPIFTEQYRRAYILFTVLNIFIIIIAVAVW